MDLSFLLRGLLIGFSIAAVVGPIGLLCISRTLRRGFLYGFVTGLGAATADATYGCIAAFGLTLISGFLISQQTWIRLLGGLFLLYLGLRTMFSKPAQKAAQARGESYLLQYPQTDRKKEQSSTLSQPAEQPDSLYAEKPKESNVFVLGAYASATLLTLTNPLTILSFAAIFAGLGVGVTSTNGLSAALVVAGVFCGSGAWWLLLSGGVSLVRERLTPLWLVWINRCAGLAITIFGLVAVLSIQPHLI